MSETTLQKIEGDLNLASEVGAAIGGPIGAGVAAALPGVEGAVNSVVAEAPHQTALTDIVNAVAAAGPVIAAAPINATNKAQAAAGLSLFAELVAFLKSIL
jgi:hypothetical protein